MALQFVLLPILAAQFGLNYSQVGLLRAISNTAMSVLEIPAGILAARFGERRLLVFGLVTAGIGYLGVALSPGFIAVALFFLVAGSGAAFQHSLASSALVITFTGASRRRALGVYNSSGDAGKLLYTGLFSLGLGTGLSWNIVVIGLASFAIVFAAVLFYWLRNFKSSISSTENFDKGIKPGRWGVIDRPGFTILGIVVFLDSAVQMIFLSFLAFVLLEKGASNSVASVSVVFALTGGMIGKYLGGYLAAKWGDRYAFIVIQLLTIVGLILLMRLSINPLLVALPFIGMAVQGSSTVTYGCIANFIEPDRQARGFALIYTLASLSAVAGPVAFGVLADWAGLSVSIGMLVLMTLTTLPLSFVLVKTATSSYSV